MHLRQALLDDRSKPHIIHIAKTIGDSQEHFDELFDLFLHDEDPKVTQRAAWVISHCYDRQPQLIEPHIETFWKNLLKPQPDGIKRNTVRIFQEHPLPESVQGIAASICFNFLEDPNEAVAVKAFSMTVLYNLGLQQPDLLPELEILIEDMLPHGTAGIKSRGKKILKAIRARK